MNFLLSCRQMLSTALCRPMSGVCDSLLLQCHCSSVPVFHLWRMRWQRQQLQQHGRMRGGMREANETRSVWTSLKFSYNLRSPHWRRLKPIFLFNAQLYVTILIFSFHFYRTPSAKLEFPDSCVCCYRRRLQSAGCDRSVSGSIWTILLRPNDSTVHAVCLRRLPR